MRMLLILMAALQATNPVFARGKRAKDSLLNPRFESNRGPGPYNCDNGRTYELRGRTILVDGIPAMNGVSYQFWGSADGTPQVSLYENGFVRGTCELANPPPPAPRPKQWDYYVKVCDPDCRWETREVR